ncbi:MAG: FecR family protein [Lentimicrobium sp.]
MKEETTYYESLMVAYFSGEATPGEIRQLSSWLTENQENLDSFESFRKLWLLAGKDALSSAIDLDAEWEAISPKLSMDAPVVDVPAEKPGKGKLISILSSWKAAAALVILLVSATAVFYLSSGPEMITLTAGAGNLEQLLPDGTTITLFKGSEAEYPAQFSGDKREVKLEGEAYFIVKHDETKPFIVKGNSARIEVLGTSFNVNTKAGDDQLSVVLTSGKVSLYFKGHESDKIILHPGEKAEMNLSRNAISVGVNPDPNYMAWKTGKIVFDNSSLSDVIAVLSKVYQKEIRLAGNQLSACSLTATFEKQPLSSVMNVIKATLELEITEENGTLILNGPQCN